MNDEYYREARSWLDYYRLQSVAGDPTRVAPKYTIIGEPLTRVPRGTEDKTVLGLSVPAWNWINPIQISFASPDVVYRGLSDMGHPLGLPQARRGNHDMRLLAGPKDGDPVWEQKWVQRLGTWSQTMVQVGTWGKGKHKFIYSSYDFMQSQVGEVKLNMDMVGNGKKGDFRPVTIREYLEAWYTPGTPLHENVYKRMEQNPTYIPGGQTDMSSHVGRKIKQYRIEAMRVTGYNIPDFSRAMNSDEANYLEGLIPGIKGDTAVPEPQKDLAIGRIERVVKRLRESSILGIDE